MQTQQKSTPEASKDAAATTRQRSPDLREVDVRTGLSVLDLVKTLAYMDAVELEQLRITKKEDGWLLMLKGTFRNQKRIAFVSARRFEDVLQQAVTSADCGYLHWKEDRPPWERK